MVAPEVSEQHLGQPERQLTGSSDGEKCRRETRLRAAQIPIQPPQDPPPPTSPRLLHG